MGPFASAAVRLVVHCAGLGGQRTQAEPPRAAAHPCGCSDSARGLHLPCQPSPSRARPGSGAPWVNLKIGLQVHLPSLTTLPEVATLHVLWFQAALQPASRLSLHFAFNVYP